MFKRVWEEILKSDNIVLASHVNPDGDTIGCILALFDILKKAGKNLYLFSKTKELPQKYSFLSGFDKISNTLPSKFDLILTCDCATFERTGLKKGDFKIINIDHHTTNANFGNENLVLRDASSAAMVVYKMLKFNKVVFSKEAAEALYVGIVDDTKFFTNGNLDDKTFLNVSDIVSKGVDVNLVASKLAQNVSLAKFRLHERVFKNIYLLKNGKVASVVVLQKDLKKTGAKREDAEDLANILRSLADVEFSFSILEEEDKTFKISLRSKPESIDVSKIAFKFGGGGHRLAAGFESDLQDTNEITVKILKEYDKEINFADV